MEETIRITAEIPEDDGITNIANLFFVVDPYACNQLITDTMPARYDRDIDVTFVLMYCSIHANVCASLDLQMPAAAVCHVYSEITAHHELYGDGSVMLFFCQEGDGAEVVDGKFLLLRPWTAALQETMNMPTAKGMLTAICRGRRHTSS